MQAKFTSTVNPRLREAIKKFPLTNEDMGALLIGTDKIFSGLMLHAFRTEGSISGGKWKVKDEVKLLKQKLREGAPGRKIMQRTRALRRSLVNRGDPGHVKETRLSPRPTITLGTRQFILKFHVDKGRDVMQHTAHQEQKYYREIEDYYIKVKFPRVLAKLREWRRKQRGVA